jgi:hypothetical protein
MFIDVAQFGHGAAPFRFYQDEINRLVLYAERRGSILRGQLIVKLDYIGQSLEPHTDESLIPHPPTR